MLEKDIENLIAKYPDEFFPKKRLKLIGQQIKLGPYIADILFETDNEKVIIEVKRGILTRESFGTTLIQISDYYGYLKKNEPHSKIKLIIVANVIDENRIELISENFPQLEFEQISISKIVQIANKYSYEFLDKESPKLKEEYKQEILKTDKEINYNNSNIWIFQANPKTFDIINALTDEKELERGSWLVKTFKNEIRMNDYAIIWMSNSDSKSKDGGIYALAQIKSDPYYFDSESNHWKHGDEPKKSNNLRVKLDYKIILLNNPILREELKSIKELEYLSIFRQPQGTNFRVKPEEWDIINKLIKERIK